MSELEGRISSSLSRPAPVGPIMPSILVTLLLILGKGVSVCLGDVQKREIIHEASLFFFIFSPIFICFGRNLGPLDLVSRPKRAPHLRGIARMPPRHTTHAWFYIGFSSNSINLFFVSLSESSQELPGPCLAKSNCSERSFKVTRDIEPFN